MPLYIRSRNNTKLGVIKQTFPTIKQQSSLDGNKPKQNKRNEIYSLTEHFKEQEITTVNRKSCHNAAYQR